MLASAATAQEKSVRPGVNKSYEKPGVDQFITKFEREGREVFDQREKIVKACGLKPGMVVADIGCGTGLFTRLFAKEVGPKGRVYAVDIMEKFLDHIEKTCREQKLGNVVGVHCTAKSSKLRPDSVDLVFICNVYHHFEFPLETMKTVHQALRPGGTVVMIDFERIEGKSPEWILGHVRAGKKEVTQELAQAGFVVASEETFMKDDYFLRLKKAAQSIKDEQTK